ncbi:MAG: formylmethanofuran dehydrogenase subunit C [Candidatus Methanomethylicia archaeon]|nr:formylmethanofuran dehydrogenase subunit C [Candidatus Methanomethylicia archaeon]
MSTKYTYIFKLKRASIVPIDVRNISPYKFIGKSLDEIKKFKVFEGGREATIEDLFEVDGPASSPKDVNSIEIIVNGFNTNKLRYLGYKMNGGKIVVKGDVGHFIGYKMSNGSITVEGRAGSYIGAKMKGGSIEVFKDCGDCIGGKLPGEKLGKGMSGGSIVIHGNAGSQVGVGMKGGRILIDGNVGMLCGSYMTGGTIIVRGNCHIYPGSRMIGGRIIIGGRVEGILPSFYVDSIVPSIKVREVVFPKPFMVFIADVIVGGRGMLYISLQDNEELLKPYKEVIKEVVEIE